MQIISRNGSRKKIAVIGVIIAVLIVSSGTYYLYGLKGSLFGWSPSKKDTPLTSPDLNPPTTDQIKNGNQIKSNSINTNGGKPGTGGSDQPLPPTPQPNGKSIVSVSITSKNQNPSSLQIRSLISHIEAGGVCTLTLSATNKAAVIKTAPAQALPSAATCEGFNIPLADLSPGDWKLTLSYESTNLTGTATDVVKVN